MKVIDLLNKIANNEEVPKKIKYSGKEYAYDIEHNDYVTTKRPHDVISLSLTWSYQYSDEIEIIEEKPKKIEEIKNRYDKQAIINYKQANFNSTDMKEICKTIGFLMQYLDEARDTINELTKAVNYLLEKESDK